VTWGTDHWTRLARWLLGPAMLSVALAAAPAGSDAAARPRCSTHDFRIAESGEQAALGRLYVTFAYRNITNRSCLTGGFPAVTLLGMGGRKLGVARKVELPRHPGVLDVRPGGRVFDIVVYAHFKVDGYSCHAVTGARIDAPDSTQSSRVTIPQGSMDCLPTVGVYPMQRTTRGLG
jgi:hypothetical protein